MARSTEVFFNKDFVFLSDPQIAAVLFAVDKVAQNVFLPDSPAWKWLLPAMASWKESILYSGHGLIDPRFDDILTNKGRVADMLQLMKEVRNYFGSFGSVIPISVMNDEIYRGHFRAIKNVDTKPFLDAVDILAGLLAANIDKFSSDSIHDTST